MQELTPQGQDIINDIAARYNLSVNSAVDMLSAVNRGGGTMAQFSCPELGSGQWMRGGMTMVSDMFNHGLKATVNNLCAELSDALANNQMFPPLKPGSGGNNWWPGDLGSPSSSGGQNNVRYAYFPQTRRLAGRFRSLIRIFIKSAVSASSKAVEVRLPFRVSSGPFQLSISLSFQDRLFRQIPNRPILQNQSRLLFLSPFKKHQRPLRPAIQMRFSLFLINWEICIKTAFLRIRNSTRKKRSYSAGFR